jgi:AcrR family transcriptional regulator
MEKTEHKILQTAIELFASKGFHATSVREIVEHAGLTKPALYYYFKNKEQLAKKVLESAFSELLAQIEKNTAPKTNLKDKLKAVVMAHFNFVERYPSHAKFVYRVFFGPETGPMRDMLEQNIRRPLEGIINIMRTHTKAGELRLPIEIAATVFCGMFNIFEMAFFTQNPPALKQQLADSIVEVFLNGICKKGRKNSL